MREIFRATGPYGVSGRSALRCSVCSLSLVTANNLFHLGTRHSESVTFLGAKRGIYPIV
jgi:hypothetical protein